MESFKVVDLFAGCGGLSLGFEQAGFEVVEGYEMKEEACALYNKNLSGVCRSVRLSEGHKYPPCSVVIGGPPCQPFSIGGKQHGREDARDCVPIFLDCVERTKPLFALMENVANLAGKRHVEYLALLTKQLRDLGYEVDTAILNSSHYGVPQCRKRLFVAAHRGGFSFDKMKKNHLVTVAEVLEPASFCASSGDKYPELLLTENMDNYISRYEMASKCKNPRDLHPDKPARTLTCRNLYGCTSDMMRIRLSDGRRRQLTVGEAARLQTFPENFFEGCTRKTAMECIGNSVPPLLARTLADAILEHLRESSNSPPFLVPTDRKKDKSADEPTTENTKPASKRPRRR